MKPKILITMQGGVIQHVSANMDIEYAIVDYDEARPFSGVLEADSIVDGNFSDVRNFEVGDVEEEQVFFDMVKANF